MTPSPSVQPDESHTTVAAVQQQRRVGGLVTLVTVLVILAATLNSARGQPDLAPFCLVCGSAAGVDAVLNVLLFVPLGIGLALLQVPARFALIAMPALSALIELTQFFIVPGRNGTLGDFLTNSLGAAIGYAIGRYAHVWMRRDRRTAAKCMVAGATLWIAVQTVSTLAFRASFPNSRYYGQIARSFAELSTFRGQVLSATVDSMEVPDVAFEDSRRVRDLLRDHSYFAVTIIPANRTSGIAPIVRIADREQREIAILAQRHDDFVFAVRSEAAVLRLRVPFFAVRHVFAHRGTVNSATTIDTLRLRSREVGKGIDMEVRGTHSATITQRIRIHPSLGWTLILPFQWYIEGSRLELLLSGMWTGVFFLPLGYWAARARKEADERDPIGQILLLILATALLSVGMVAIPRLGGVSADTVSDWLAGWIALLTGYALARDYRGRETGLLATDPPTKN